MEVTPHPNPALEAAFRAMEARATEISVETVKRAPAMEAWRLAYLIGWSDDRIAAAGRADLIARIRTLKESERKRCRAGHWSADLNRLTALKQAYVQVRLEALRARPRRAAA
ncbi:hypothetical protein [Microbaculum marinum]|uniref:Uncharacterized protein n=1 Tax=Microbaculum marinum TaxID=1764581 RepID=A0AAW9RT74_9HYPH